MASKSIILSEPLKNCHLFGLDANRKMYSRVNQVIHIASTRASLSLSVRFPCESITWKSGRVLRHSATVDTTMKVMLRVATT
jgi:hypothetical protein